MWPFTKPKPAPPTIVIRDRAGLEIDRVQGWDLCNKDIRNRNWPGVDLSGLNLDGSDLTGSNMIGANLRRASLRYCKLVGCEISYADATSCDFSGANMVGCLMYRSETYTAKFHDVLLSEESDVPGIRVFRNKRGEL
jgi:uncharacterized protein YjbI with pentapeptide repeats